MSFHFSHSPLCPPARPDGATARRTGLSGCQSARWLLLVGWLVGLSQASGCARRAYTELYVENMAAEIRQLEDDLYFYDGEYRALEQQLKALKAENARLRSSSPTTNNSGSYKFNSPSGDNFVPRSEPGPSVQSTPRTAPSQAAPQLAPELNPAPLSPAPLSPAPVSPAPVSPAPVSPAPLSPPPDVPGARQPLYDLDELTPPTIEPGEAMPPILPAPRRDPNTPVTLNSENDLELELGRIPLHSQLVSSPSSLAPKAELPEDQRIVSLKFHPSLCRAIKTKEQGDDDGLYVVLQTFNQSGQFVPLPADLMVLALDLSRDEKQATIGRWTLSAEQVKHKIQPIGSSQGIHLSLHFAGPAPQCDRVLVFAYYTLADGRRLVDEREVMLSNLHRQSTAWVPRARPNAAVRTASAELPR